MKTKRIIVWLTALLALVAAWSCNEFEDPPPLAPVVDPPKPSQFNITGRWDGMTNQGRPVRFDILSNGGLENGTMSLHHDCSGGRLVLRLGDYRSEVVGDSFEVTFNWRFDDGPRFYIGTLTVSGRFEGDTLVRGGFVNSITDKTANNLGVCLAVDGQWEAAKH